MGIFSFLHDRGERKRAMTNTFPPASEIDEYHHALRAQYHHDRAKDATVTTRTKRAAFRYLRNSLRQKIHTNPAPIRRYTDTPTARTQPASLYSDVSYWIPLHHKGNTRDLRAVAASHAAPQEPLIIDLQALGIFTEPLDRGAVFCDGCRESFMLGGIGCMDQERAGGFCPRCIEEAFMELAVEEDENEELIRYSNSNWI